MLLIIIPAFIFSEEVIPKGTIYSVDFYDVLKERNILPEELRGKVVVVNFWLSTCPPCIQKLPELIELYNRYSRDDVMFIGVSLDKHIKTLKAFCRVANIEWPQHCVEGYGWDTPLALQLGVDSTPTVLLFDQRGSLFSRDACFNLAEQLEELLAMGEIK